jgi:hypothetical protein
MADRFTIERGRGATYRTDRWHVYRHSVYPRRSVLAGQPRRVFVDDFASLDEARVLYPTARVLDDGATTYRPPDLSHLSDDTDY